MTPGGRGSSFHIGIYREKSIKILSKTRKAVTCVEAFTGIVDLSVYKSGSWVRVVQWG